MFTIDMVDFSAGNQGEYLEVEAQSALQARSVAGEPGRIKRDIILTGGGNSTTKLY